MKLAISTTIQAIFLILGLPFFIMDKLIKNKPCGKIINLINLICYRVNWWGRK